MPLALDKNLLRSSAAVLALVLGSSALGTMFSSNTSAHSAMFPDQFQYDGSGEGELSTIASASSSRPAKAKAVLSNIDCENGLAGDYLCRNIDLRAQMSRQELGGGDTQLSDIWGWTDLNTGMEIAIVGKTNGTSFVDITDPVNPQLLGFLPSHNAGVDDWRDIKVYQDHAFIVADGNGNNTHGLQIYDMTQLAVVAPGSVLSETAHHAGFGSAHNIVINEDSGFAYVVGANQCSGGLYMVDVSSPASPQAAGCFADDGYTHDAQCVTYQGPDTRFFGQEICVAYNEDTITIVDVTTKSNPLMLSRTTYPGAQYTHQGWFVSENHNYVVMNDELDESRDGVNTTSYIWDLSLLDAPVETGRYVGASNAIDHNLYSRDGYIFESNYREGLRILDASNVDSGSMSERAYFDTIPCSNDSQFSGAWSSYVDFASGNLVLSDIDNGLFVLRPDQAAIVSNANDTAPASSPACATTPTDPEPTDPEPTDPEPTDPEPTDPEPTDPEPTDPEPTDPEPTDPEPTDPEPTDPEPAEPTPAAPEEQAPSTPEQPTEESEEPSSPEQTSQEPAVPETTAPETTTTTSETTTPATAASAGGGGSMSIAGVLLQLVLYFGLRRRRQSVSQY
ncbi:MAG: choice-of-anchor B family protein [Pseudomonadales bacterium]